MGGFGVVVFSRTTISEQFLQHNTVRLRTPTCVCVSVCACLCLTPCASLWCVCKKVCFFLPNPCSVNMRTCLCGSFYAHCELFIIQTLLSPSSSLPPFFLSFSFFFFSRLHPEQRFTPAPSWQYVEHMKKVILKYSSFFDIFELKMTFCHRLVINVHCCQGLLFVLILEKKNFCHRMTFSVSFGGACYLLWFWREKMFALEWRSVSIVFRARHLFWFWKKPFALEWHSVSIPFRVLYLFWKKICCLRMTFNVTSFQGSLFVLVLEKKKLLP